MSFEWDNKKAEINLSKHKVSFEEAKDVFKDKNRVTKRTDRDNEIRNNTIGKTNRGLLSVIWTPRNKNKRFISARKANKKETKWYN